MLGYRMLEQTDEHNWRAKMKLFDIEDEFLKFLIICVLIGSLAAACAGYLSHVQAIEAIKAGLVQDAAGRWAQPVPLKPEQESEDSSRRPDQHH